MPETIVTETTTGRERLLTPATWWFMLFCFTGNCSLSILFSALPLFAERATGYALAAGLTTGTMMLATVLVELVTPRLMADLGYRRVMEIGTALLGLPALLLVAVPNLATILAVAVARGAGLAITVVAGTALAARMFPAARRAEGLGVFGLVISLPAILVLPLGLWLAEHFSFNLVFILAAVLAVAGMVMGRALPTLHPGARPTHGIMAELADPGIRRPAIIFGCATLAVGILITYLALAVPEDARGIAAIGLFVQAICTSIARWVAGRLGDRVGSHHLLAPSMLLAALGMGCIVATGNPVALLAGMALFGLGLGGAQNASLAVMFDRAPKDRFAQVSVIWNLAYDTGMGIGAVGFGLLSGVTGYAWGFALVSALLLATVIPAWRDRAPVRIPAVAPATSDH